ncbi:heavy metal translocating P-type ATPase [Reinekea sp.]|uniref:heavy metal translocating P-type ATPase n=1 Tax=Reinekea sp. TaxID=1970455 RepID=UPI003989C674
MKRSVNMNSKPLDLVIEGAGCASCVGKIESALNSVEGVHKAEMNFAQRTVQVSGDANAEDLIKAVENAGYNAKPMKAEDDAEFLNEKEEADLAHQKKLFRQMAIALTLGVPLMVYSLVVGEMNVSTTSEQVVWGVVGLATLAVMLTSGRHFYVGAWRSFLNHSANMDTLIALGTGTAWVYSMVIVFAPFLVPEMARHVYFEATAMIIGLINLGLALEVKARGKTSQAIKRLIGLQPKKAVVIRDGKDVDINIEQVLLGDIVRLKPGDKVAVDGEVVDGKTTVDESMLTGEPVPVKKQPGDEVAAGSINKSGSILFKATRVGSETALAQIIEMVKRAQNSKPPIGRLADVISAYFVPVIMIISVVSALVWLNFGPAPAIAYALVSATTVLIIACPCALGLATPMSVMVGVGKAAESGVLIRNGEALQTASKITAMILDKTGTITEGQPALTDLQIVENYSRADVLSLLGSIEQASEHPLAEAIVEAAKAENIELSSVSEFMALSGKGVTGIVDGQKLAFGNQKLMDEFNLDNTLFMSQSDRLAEDAKTPMFFAIDQRVVALAAVSDPIKLDSKAAIERLIQQGTRVVMLTGDNKKTADAVAKKIGIKEVFSEVMPEEKADKVKQLQVEGEIVGMTGDGINDAPALALADVGFAIGTGTDVAMESADVTLMRGSLHGLADAIAVSKATLANIKQNLFGAFIYNVAGVPIAAGLLYPIFGLLLSPVIAGAAMAFSSVTVVTNANRLRLFKPGQH